MENLCAGNFFPVQENYTEPETNQMHFFKKDWQSFGSQA